MPAKQRQQIARIANMASDVPVVIVLAMAIPFVLVGAVVLAIYGDIVKKRSRWTGLELPAEPGEARLAMQEMYEEEAAPRSGLGRKGYIKRWLVLLSAGVLVGVARELVPAFLPFGLAVAVSFILVVCYVIPAFVFWVKWSTERVEDAGRNGAWGLLILVPVLNILALIVFSSLPSRSSSREVRPEKV